MTKDDSPADSSDVRASALLARFNRIPHEDLDRDFGFLCDDHPDEAGALRRLRDRDERGEGQLEAESKDETASDGGQTVDARSLDTPVEEYIKELREIAVSDSRYRREGEIARGGMGAIIKVRDNAVRRTLAMKVALGKPDPNGTKEVEYVEDHKLGRFLDEAHITGQLDHPGVVPVHELGVSEDGQVYFTMRLVKGRAGYGTAFSSATFSLKSKYPR